MTNYFSNYMLKHFPLYFRREMLEHQDEYLAKLKAGEEIHIDWGLSIKMNRSGRIYLFDRTE